MTAIILSPFSNSDIRDWPLEHWTDLIRHLVRAWPGEGLIRVIGTAGQKLRACDIVREFDPARVSNDCGRLSWAALQDDLRAAACVVGNNSGIAHLSGTYGVPTVCVFGGSHQRREWRPLGPHVVVLSRTIACSPCHLDHGASCLYDKACLRQIEPALVARTVLDLMEHRPAREPAMIASLDTAASAALRSVA